MTKKKKVSTKKKKPNIKKSKPCNKKCNQDVAREKACGQPMPVKGVRPLSEYLNDQGEFYPKIFFKESWWTRFKRFLGLIP